jgi:hypothetical protein
LPPSLPHPLRHGNLACTRAQSQMGMPALPPWDGTRAGTRAGGSHGSREPVRQPARSQVPALHWGWACHAHAFALPARFAHAQPLALRPSAPSCTHCPLGQHAVCPRAGVACGCREAHMSAGRLPDLSAGWGGGLNVKYVRPCGVLHRALGRAASGRGEGASHTPSTRGPGTCTHTWSPGAPWVRKS